MPKQTKDERLAAIHSAAMIQFDRIQEAQKDERRQCLEDRRFYSIAGAQWEGAIGEQFENKPKFEVNKIHLAVIRIINEYRNNRITVDFISKDGSEDDELADVCDGLFRADERDSGAEEAYDNAFEEAVGGGFGAVRLRADYENDEDPDDDRQRIRIEPIYDADSSVWFDLDAKRQDKADANHCFLLYSMTPDAFEEEWGENPSSWEKPVSQTEFDWVTPDMVFVAEYYLVEKKTDYAITLTGPAGDEKKFLEGEADEEELAELMSIGYIETRRKRVTKKQVHKYILSGNSVLEDCGVIAGKCIPIVPTYGKRWFIDNIERCMGHVRLAKDSQRLKNIQLSKLGEISALSSVEKPILAPEQIAGFQTMWAEDNMKNYPYLLINPITGADGNPMPAAPLAYTKPPQVPQALAALIQITETDMQSILGNQQEADKMVSNISEKTVLAIQSRMDMQTFIYVSNFAKAVRRIGEVWLSMAKDVYVESGRKMKTVGKGNELGAVELRTATIDEKTGSTTKAADLTKASFDVAVEVGPSSSSRREATVRSLTGMMAATSDPETLSVLQAMAMMNMEGEGISDIKEYFRKKMVKLGALKPSNEEAQQMAQAAQTKDPQAQALESMANEADANATKARASVLKTMAEVEKINAETIETLAGVDASSTEQAVALSKEFQQQPVPTVPTVQQFNQ
jgi:hypothetical protein